MDTKDLEQQKITILGKDLGNMDNETLQYVDLNLIKPNPDQPRKEFNETLLQELADSIKQYGVLQPIIIKPYQKIFVIIAGERRWRASKIAGCTTIPAIIKNLQNKIDISAITLIENLQRKNLKITEEATFYKNFLETTANTQNELAKIIGKSRSYVANLIRINSLSNDIKDKIDQEIISFGHAKILVGHKDAQKILEAIISKNLNVRETERLAKKLNEQNSDNKPKKSTGPSLHQENLSGIKKIETSLSDLIDTQVKIDLVDDKGKITIHFNSMEQLDQILSKIGSL